MRFRWTHRLFSFSFAAAVVTATGSRVLPQQSSDQPLKLIEEENRRRAKLVGKAVRRFLTISGAPGATVAVSVNGRLRIARGFGFADVENGTRCQAETVMRIASISKPITAVITARLVESGKMNWDDSVYKYLHDFPRKKIDGKDVDITIRQLLSHTSGIRHYKKTAEDEDFEHYGRGDKDFEFLSREPYKTISDALAMFKDDDLVAEPGTKFTYTTHGFTLLSACAEKAAEERFDRLLVGLFRNLTMRSTYVDKNEDMIPNRAKFYRRNNSKNLVHVPEVDTSYKIAGGGIVSNVLDLIKFANAMLLSFQSTDDSKQLLRSTTVDEMWLSKPTPPGGYVLGWQRLNPRGESEDERKQREGTWCHTGASVGTSSILLVKANPVVPHADLPQAISVAILVNMQDVGGGSITRLALDIVDIFESQFP